MERHHEAALDEPIMVGTAEASRLLGGISRATLFRWDRAGYIRLVRIGGRTLVPISEIRRIAAPGAGEAGR
ncbi:hypothetical protein [Methylocella sp.]|uniref:hypothetical protein n=1 Tax=Methylocella sp. TaxID=1978226 RepID=UPI003784BD49